MHSRYMTERLSAMQIGVMLGCSGRTVLNALEAHGIPRRTNERDRAKVARLADAEWLPDRYVVDGMSIRQIADSLHVHNTLVGDALRSTASRPVRRCHPNSVTPNGCGAPTRRTLASRSPSSSACLGPQSTSTCIATESGVNRPTHPGD